MNDTRVFGSTLKFYLFFWEKSIVRIHLFVFCRFFHGEILLSLDIIGIVNVSTGVAYGFPNELAHNYMILRGHISTGHRDIRLVHTKVLRTILLTV